jgi:hypothetical protein
VDEYYSSDGGDGGALAAAVGAEEDGRFGLNDAVFFPNAIVVTDVHTAVGASVGPSSVLLTVQAGREPIEGDDVSQLQEAMVRLGYGAPTSGTFDDATRVAVESWQSAVGPKSMVSSTSAGGVLPARFASRAGSPWAVRSMTARRCSPLPSRRA